MYRIFKILLIILILITLTEIVYYFYVSYYSKKNNFAPETVNSNPKPSNINSPTMYQKNLSDEKFEDIIKYYYELVNKNSDGNIYLVIEQKASIGNIIIRDRDNYLVINNNKGEIIGEYFLDNNISIYSIKNNTKIPISPRDLKLNDKLTIKIRKNLITKQESVEFEINP